MQSVIAQVKENGTAANPSLEDAYRAHLKLLFRYALALVENEADAEDILHTVFARLAAKPGVNMAHARSYLLRAVRNECVSHGRRKRRTLSLTLVEDIPGRESRAAPAVNRALAELEADAREIVVLRVYEDMTFREIAQAIGTSETTARERYNKALGQLKRILERQ